MTPMIGALAAVAACAVVSPAEGGAAPENFFQDRGYYITFMRMPTYDLGQWVFAAERTWRQPSPVVSPERVRAMIAQGKLTPAARKRYRAALDRLRGVAERCQGGTPCERELLRIARWVLSRWEGENRRLLAPLPSSRPE